MTAEPPNPEANSSETSTAAPKNTKSDLIHWPMRQNYSLSCPARPLGKKKPGPFAGAGLTSPQSGLIGFEQIFSRCRGVRRVRQLQRLRLAELLLDVANQTHLGVYVSLDRNGEFGALGLVD